VLVQSPESAWRLLERLGLSPATHREPQCSSTTTVITCQANSATPLPCSEFMGKSVGGSWSNNLAERPFLV